MGPRRNDVHNGFWEEEDDDDDNDEDDVKEGVAACERYLQADRVSHRGRGTGSMVD